MTQHLPNESNNTTTNQTPDTQLVKDAPKPRDKNLKRKQRLREKRRKRNNHTSKQNYTRRKGMLHYRKYSHLSMRKQKTYQLVSASEEERPSIDMQGKRDTLDIAKYSSCDVDKDLVYTNMEVDKESITDDTDDEAIVDDSKAYQLWEDEEAISILEDKRQG